MHFFKNFASAFRRSLIHLKLRGNTIAFLVVVLPDSFREMGARKNSAETHSLFTWSKQKWLFWRAGFFPAIQSFRKLFKFFWLAR